MNLANYVYLVSHRLTCIVITISAITQVRVMGGVIGVAVAQAVLNHQISTTLASVLGQEKLAALLESATAISTFTPQEIALTSECYGIGFNLVYKVMLGFALAALLTSLGCWQRHPLNFSDLKKRRIKGERTRLS